MSTIRPFAAVRYQGTSDSADISTKLAPPYDVLSDEDKAQLLASDAQNFVKVDLPHTPPKDAGPAEVYEAAARQIDAWLAEGVFVRDETPAIYAYHQSFNRGGLDYTRKMFFARLRIEPFGKGSVFPHEQTFGGPKEDRLALTKATKANLSPIFGLYEDASNVVAAELEQSLTTEPLLFGGLDATDNKLWAVTDEEVIANVTRLMREKAMYIADGHHRYGTAMLYRDWLIEQNGPLPEDHPANYVLCVLCAMEDPGLLILPTHRVLPGVSIPATTLKKDEAIEIAHLLADTGDEAIRALAKFGPQAIAMWNGRDKGFYVIRPWQAGLLDTLETEHSEAWRRLGLAFLHAYMINRVIAPKATAGQPPEVRYLKAAQAAIDTARETGGTAFLMQPTTMEELRGVCGAGDLMPQKSTFFYPKLASGLVVNPLTD